MAATFLTGFPYVTGEMLVTGEAELVAMIMSKFPQYSWLSAVSTGALNVWILTGLANEINALTGAQPPAPAAHPVSSVAAAK